MSDSIPFYLLEISLDYLKNWVFLKVENCIFFPMEFLSEAAYLMQQHEKYARPE